MAFHMTNFTTESRQKVQEHILQTQHKYITRGGSRDVISCSVRLAILADTRHLINHAETAFTIVCWSGFCLKYSESKAMDLQHGQIANASWLKGDDGA